MHVVLAEDDGARLSQPGGHGRIVPRAKMPQSRRPRRGRVSLDVDIVLECDRDAVKRTDGSAAQPKTVRIFRLCSDRFRVEVDKGIGIGEFPDLVDERVGDFDGAHFAWGKKGGQFRAAQFVDVRRHCSVTITLRGRYDVAWIDAPAHHASDSKCFSATITLIAIIRHPQKCGEVSIGMPFSAPSHVKPRVHCLTTLRPLQIVRPQRRIVAGGSTPHCRSER